MPAPEPNLDLLSSKLGLLSIEDKAAMTAGRDVWTVPGSELIGVPPLRMTDGPNGARGGAFAGEAARSICVPCGSALGATFNPALIKEVGALLGREARQKRSRVLLAPTINLHRSPLYGRSFECYSEDPLLSGHLAASFITGVQSEGVATTPKHFVGNETEYQRQTINSIIDERTLREIYLLPFEWAVRHGGALGIMTSYNRLNGVYCTEDPELLGTILRDEWGFEGFVVSDWFAAGSTVASLEAGLDVQMPGPDRWFGAPVAKAVANGEAGQVHLDRIVERRVHVHTKLDAWDDDTDLAELGEETEADRDLARRAAIESMVLLTNNGMLPLSPDLDSVALIGPNAVTAHIMGGGSAQLAAHRRVTPQQVLEQRLGDRLRTEPGCVIDKNAPPVRPANGFKAKFFASPDWSGDVVGETMRKSGRVIWAGPPIEALGSELFSTRMTGELEITVTGEHTFTLIQTSDARVLIDGQVVLDGITEKPPQGEAFFGLGSVEMEATLALEAGQRVEIVVELSAPGSTSIRGVQVGHQPPVPAGLKNWAVSAAEWADAAIVVVGTSSEWETEGEDRESIDLPGDQNELIEAVCAVNPNTVVVVNAGAPVSMPWVSRPAAVLQSWLGGQEMSSALDAVLFGEDDPGGRLPMTMPLAIEHTPAFGNFPGEANQTLYGEGLLVGYRWYESRKLPVAFPFGHGLSYADFWWDEADFVASGPAAGTITVPVTNTSHRAGSEVVQVYVEPPAGELFRPTRALAGFAKVTLEPKEKAMVTIDLSPRSFAIWDPVNTEHVQVAHKMSGSGAPPATAAELAELGSAGWYVPAGEYTVHVAHSVADLASSFTVVVEDRLGPLTDLP